MCLSRSACLLVLRRPLQVSVLSGLAFAQYYMDDIIVGGKDEAELTRNLIAVFEKLNAGNLKILLSKVQFF